MITDLNRLHKVVSGELTGRRCGTTFSKCHEVATLCEFNNVSPIIIIVENYNDINHIIVLLYSIFIERELSFKQIKDTRLVCSNGVVIDFVLLHKFKEFVSGCSEYYEVTMTRPMLHIGNDREHSDLARRIAAYAAQDKFILDDESVRYDKETLKKL